MATTLIKEKISKLVASQLPEFIQNDYSTFVSFIEAYYRFLEQDQGAFELIQNSRKYSDIDQTTDSFVQYFLKQYVNDVPTSKLVNDRFLVKKIKDLYESKGSELSFKLLFNILFNEDVSVSYPYENVLRASAGKWQQNFSIRVETVSGDRSLLANRILTYTYNGLLYEIPILRVKNLTSTQTELFLDNEFLPPTFDLNDEVFVYNADGSEFFTGTIKPTTTSYEISQRGLGFKKGQIFTINAFTGVGTLVKVSNVTSNGGISELNFVNYGYNYNTDPQTFFTVALSNTASVSEVYNSFISKTQGFSDTLTVVVSDPTSPERYFDADYLSDPFYTLTNVLVASSATTAEPAELGLTGNVPGNLAVIIFRLGGLSRYQGSYFTNESFLSEADVRLEDDLLYQPFAYQLETGLDISTFFDVVQQLIHPAGQRLFNKRVLSANIDLSINQVLSPSQNVFFESYDSFEARDLYEPVFFKNVSDTSTITEADFIDFTKVEVDSLDPADLYTSQINKNIIRETIFSFDPLSPERYFEEEYAEGNTYTFTSVTVIDNETVSVTDDIEVNFRLDRDFVDTANVLETVGLLTNKFINNTENIVNITESIGVQIGEQDYLEEDFVSELYVATLNTII